MVLPYLSGRSHARLSPRRLARPPPHPLRLGDRRRLLSHRPLLFRRAGLAGRAAAALEPRVRLAGRRDFHRAGGALRPVRADGAVCGHPDGTPGATRGDGHRPVVDRRRPALDHAHDAILATGAADGGDAGRRFGHDGAGAQRHRVEPLVRQPPRAGNRLADGQFGHRAADIFAGRDLADRAFGLARGAGAGAGQLRGGGRGGVCS